VCILCWCVSSRNTLYTAQGTCHSRVGPVGAGWPALSSWASSWAPPSGAQAPAATPGRWALHPTLISSTTISAYAPGADALSHDCVAGTILWCAIPCDGAAVQGVVALAGSAYATAIAVGIFNAAAAQPPTATERQVLIRERAAGGRSQRPVEIRLFCAFSSDSFPNLMSCLTPEVTTDLHICSSSLVGSPLLQDRFCGCRHVRHRRILTGHSHQRAALHWHPGTLASRFNAAGCCRLLLHLATLLTPQQFVVPLAELTCLLLPLQTLMYTAITYPMLQLEWTAAKVFWYLLMQVHR
jgi:hypothetical protein